MSWENLDFVLFLIVIFNVHATSSPTQFCSHHSGKEDAAIRLIEQSIAANVVENDMDSIVFCDQQKSTSCYALFKSTANKIEIISAGCLAKNASSANGIGAKCNNDNCTALSNHLVGEDEVELNKSKTGFCCCSTRLCNQRVLKPKIQKSTPVLVYQLEPKPHGRDSNSKTGYLVLILAIVSLLTVGAILVFLAMRHLHRKVFTAFNPCNSCESRQGGVPGAYTGCDEQRVMMELGALGDGTYIEKDGTTKIASSPSNGNIVDNNNVKLMKLIGQGRYGTVWHALMRDTEQEVAVKLYKSEHKLYFNNELNIYQVPLMQHPNIVSFIAGSWRVNEDEESSSSGGGGGGVNEYMLVMDYIPNGSLMAFLTHNSFPFHAMATLAHSAATGLAYLHSEVICPQGGQRKPAIVHRDFNSRNILVKRDGSCAVSDLGFAQKVSGADSYGYTTSLIPDVGTLRYMPPEVLEGSVDLNKCESALKQIDVYALALVLWEISSRCDEFYPGYPSQRSPEFRLPFQAELGQSLKFDEMRNLVSVQQGRPVFPSGWIQGNEAVRCLMDTIQESWDQDSEARLTAACVVSRLASLSSLWNNGIIDPDDDYPHPLLHNPFDPESEMQLPPVSVAAQLLTSAGTDLGHMHISVATVESAAANLDPSDAEHNSNGDRSSLVLEVSATDLHTAPGQMPSLPPDQIDDEDNERSSSV